MAQQPIFRLLLLTLLTILPSLTTAQQQLSPALPLKASSRWILDANNNRLKFRCVNWAGHQEANIPEGLDKQPVSFIVNWIRAQGFNCVRLTYSTDHALNPSLKVSDSFIAAASAAGVSVQDTTTLYNNVVAKNPTFAGNITTREVFASVIDTLWAAGIFTILDNHVSKASWCCNINDGNGWWDEAFGYNTWNSRFFKTRDWLQGLKEMAIWAKSHPGVVAMSLRNELRAFLLQDLNGRSDWYKFIKQGGDIVHANNPDVLIIVGGAQSSTDLVHLRDGNRMLDLSGWGRDKHVWEMHAYSFTINFPDPFQNCDWVKTQYGLYSGFVLEQGKPYTGPLILSEFGVGMTGGSEDGLVPQDSRYLNCLVDYMTSNDADWAVWALQGTYYIREGKVDVDEGWGLMNRDWSGWRNEKFRGMLKGMWNVTQGP